VGKRIENNQPGQVLLIIVLLITVVITVGLSIATRSLVNVRLASQEDQSQRAFSAAEAGLEQSLLSNAVIPNGAFTNSSSYKTSVTTVQGTDFLLNNGKLALKDEGTDLWLSTYSSDPAQSYTNQWTGTVTIFWGSPQDTCNTSETVNTMAALEVVLLTGSKANPTATHYAFDPCAPRRSANNFSPANAGGTAGSTSFANSVQIALPGNGLIARVIPLYANTYVGIKGSSVLPEQGTLITSTGVAGDVQRKVTVLKENPTLPTEMFSYTFLWPK
jgi:hypothetical protein